PGFGPGWLDPGNLFRYTMEPLRAHLVRRAYHDGRPDEMMVYWRAARVEASDGSIEGLDDLYADFGDEDHRPLALFGRAVGTEAGGDRRRAAELFVELHRRYPRCRLA